jgi:D-threonate/D-erythronate kinase
MGAAVSRVVTIIADDLTGACDTGCLFAGPGPVGVEAEPALRAGARPVITVDTETRRLPPDRASAVVRATARRLRERLAAGPVFKKIDSTMRGAVAAEVTALLEDGSRFSGALVCPAFPTQRRIVTDGRLLVDGAPVHESPIGRDSAFPGGTSALVDLLAGGLPVVPLGLDEVRAGCEKIAHRLERHAGAVVAADAETDADLATLAEAALSRPGTLIAGSAGLGRAVSHALGCAAPVAALPTGRAWLVVIGSLHPASRGQLAALTAAGIAVVSVDGSGPADPAPVIAALAAGRPAVVASASAPAARDVIAHQLAATAARILERAEPDLVAVTGGDTAYALLHAVRPLGFDLQGAPADGLALGRLSRQRAPALPLLTKAGGFGAADLFTMIPGETS